MLELSQMRLQTVVVMVEVHWKSNVPTVTVKNITTTATELDIKFYLKQSDGTVKRETHTCYYQTQTKLYVCNVNYTQC